MAQRVTPVHPGARFGELVVGHPIRKNEHSQVQWSVKCDCGRKTVAWGYALVKKQKIACGGRKHITPDIPEVAVVAPPQPDPHCITCRCYGKKKTQKLGR